ncbi:Serine/threonine-protein kinase PrkC [Caulifigura coniformis]|uniref:Serine/threonine-protein kinase PrkC n=1 Tax=Caulifigura coniformis TaxID=2527983 RepID=A0A517S9B7_9PLAN|nr:serine/threonine-protein kinase [Caulifigura coniformis]QDT52718.1 Serine/threonine-protein kinase PrkC [Caulifigura coniformis]
MKFLKKLFAPGPAKARPVDVKKRFELIGRVGQGSMSKVWRARDSMSGKPVALKVLDKAKTARLEKRFVGLNRPPEGVVAIGLRHPNIVRTHEHGLTTDGEQYLVMEFVEGVGLSYLVDRQNERMKTNCLWYAVQLGEALDYLHRHQWIHRDLCPRNIIVSDEDVVKLIDFGLVVPNTPPFRAPGNRTGTASYMAPELIKRLATDERIDIFSYAVTVFEMFAKQLPWKTDQADTMESVLQHINTPPRDLKKLVPGIDEQVAATVMKGLANDPRDRWPTVRKMVDDLKASGRRLNLLPADE